MSVLKKLKEVLLQQYGQDIYQQFVQHIENEEVCLIIVLCIWFE